tara:strand:- start:127 stop:504 length:378 start_codon:yes stop_codon:yes gene_type:complete
MAHFAEINQNGTVLRVVALNDDQIRDADGRHNELLGKQFLSKTLGGEWVQTSYNATFRRRFAGIGYTYRSDLDAFIPPNPYPSWLLDENECVWEPPVEMPDDGKRYLWNEVIMEWQVREDTQDDE